uniref:CCG-binding protein 1-like n=1 Tax=Erigeron canadensis TaxID=72917 RepID=UPI001CB9CDDB|nr:CCG-binding protein 1-like [Erigeron canadensis]
MMMMIKSVPYSVNLPPLVPPPPPSTTICCSSRNNGYIPKLEPFSRSKFDRIVKDPPLIQKSENDLADYCSTLEGDPSYSCWRAYFELKDFEKEAPKEVVERVIIESGGVKSLIGCLHGISEIHKAKKELDQKNETNVVNELKSENTPLAATATAVESRRACPVPSGLPKSREEMEEEEKGRMPDSPFTRLLRSKGRSPAWFSPTPDH